MSDAKLIAELQAAMAAMRSEMAAMRSEITEQAKSQRMLLLATRQMQLGQVDAIERTLNLSPRTAELRKVDRHPL